MSEGPYAKAAELYWSAGWRGLLPVPLGQKAPVPVGFTGGTGAFPSWPDVQAWIEDRGHDNIVLRLPKDVIGVDVDAYGDKQGGVVFAELEKELGELPPTWRVTSRDDGISGIRLYRVPEGLRWPGILGPGIETVRFEHRYAVSWPSQHPNGGTYRWIGPTGEYLSAPGLIPAVPRVDHLPRLPETWIYKFTGYEKAATQERLDLDVEKARAWLSARNGTGTCLRMREALAEAMSTFGTASRHEWGLNFTNRVIWLAGEGHFGVLDVLATAEKRFVADVSGDRSDAQAEWDRLFVGAAQMAAASFTAPINTKDACYGALSAKPKEEISSIPATSKAATGSAKTAPTETTPTTDSSSTNSRSVDDAEETESSPLTFSERLASATAAAEVASPTSTTTELDLSSYDEVIQPMIELDVYKLRAKRAAQRIVDAEEPDNVLEDRVRQILLAEEAKREHQKRAEGAQKAPETLSLADVLAMPESESAYRVEGLWPVGGNVVLAAVAKAGKSTLVTNLVKALVDGEKFLGKFETFEPTGKILVIDDELDPRQIRANYARQGIENIDKVEFIPLRGSVGTFDILDQKIRSEWAEKISNTGASILILDCLRPLMDALGLNENTDAGRILVAFDALRKDAGIEEGMIVHHMGHSGDRARGDTRIRDWPDAEWKLLQERDSKGESKDDSPRFFSARGRDVAVRESMVEFDPATCGLILTGGTRQQARVRPVRDEILGMLKRTGGGIGTNGIRDAMGEHGFSQESTRHALKNLVADGLVKVVPGPNRSNLHYAVDPTQQTTRELLAA